MLAEFPWDQGGLLAGCCNRSVRAWDASTNPQPQYFEYFARKGHARDVCWNHNGKVLACASDDGRVTLLAQGSSISDYPNRKDAPLNSCQSVAVSAGSRHLAAGCSDGGVHVWELKAEKRHHIYRENIGAVVSLAFCSSQQTTLSSTNSLLASAGVGGEVVIINTLQHAKTSTLEAVNVGTKRSLSFSNSGDRIAAGSDAGTVCVWDTLSSACLAKLQHAPDSGVVAQLCMALPDLAYSAGLDRSLLWWDLRARQEVSRVVLDSPLTALAVKDDGVYYALGGSEGLVWVHDNRNPAEPVSVLRFDAMYPVLRLMWQAQHYGTSTRPTPVKSGALTPSSMPQASMPPQSLATPVGLAASLAGLAAGSAIQMQGISPLDAAGTTPQFTPQLMGGISPVGSGSQASSASINSAGIPQATGGSGGFNTPQMRGQVQDRVTPVQLRFDSTPMTAAGSVETPRLIMPSTRTVPPSVGNDVAASAVRMSMDATPVSQPQRPAATPSRQQASVEKHLARQSKSRQPADFAEGTAQDGMVNGTDGGRAGTSAAFASGSEAPQSVAFHTHTLQTNLQTYIDNKFEELRDDMIDRFQSVHLELIRQVHRSEESLKQQFEELKSIQHAMIDQVAGLRRELLQTVVKQDGVNWL